MNMKSRKLSLIVVPLLILLAACATMSPVRPSGPEPFLGEHDGMWRSSVYNTSGDVNLIINDRPDGSLELIVSLTNSRSGSWVTMAKFVDGMIIVDRPLLKMELRLYEGGRIEATYDVSGGDKGYWSLTRKKK